MTLLRKANELTVQTKIKALIYGQPGTGKTTLALSMPKPLLIDFDGGIHRVNFKHLDDVITVQVASYSDFLSVINDEDLSAFETIIVDTGGKMLDFMADYLISRNSRLNKGNGTLTLQGYGERKAEFMAVNRKIAALGKHVLYVAHRETRTDGDDTRYVPQFGGSNYDSLVTELDLVGYLEANGRKRVITFDPTSRNDGKNTCNLPSSMEVPVLVNAAGDLVGSNDFLTKKVIVPYMKRLEDRQKAIGEYSGVVDKIKTDIEAVNDAESANKFVANIDTYKHVGTSKVMAAKMLRDHCTKIGLQFNKESKVYEQVAHTSNEAVLL